MPRKKAESTQSEIERLQKELKDVHGVALNEKLSPNLREELNANLGLNIPDRSDLSFMRPVLYPNLTSDFLSIITNFMGSSRAYNDFQEYCKCSYNTLWDDLSRMVKRNDLNELVAKNLISTFTSVFPETLPAYIEERRKNKNVPLALELPTAEEIYLFFFYTLLKIPLDTAISLSKVSYRYELIRTVTGDLYDYSCLKAKGFSHGYDENEFFTQDFNEFLDEENIGVTIDNHLSNLVNFIENNHNLSYYVKGQKPPTILWYDLVYQDEELQEQFLVQMAEYKAPFETFQKYALEMFGKEYWRTVHELARKHECLRDYRLGDDGGGWEAFCAEEPEWEDLKYSLDPAYVKMVESIKSRNSVDGDGGDVSMLWDPEQIAYENKRDVIDFLIRPISDSITLRNFNVMFGDEWQTKVKEIIKGDVELEALLNKFIKKLPTLK